MDAEVVNWSGSSTLSAGFPRPLLALDDLGRGDVGHYGIGPGATRLVPAPASPNP